MAHDRDQGTSSFPTSAGVFLGIGLGDFFDGIVLHQIFQWHHMVSDIYPTNTVRNFRLNTLGDGLFHAGTYVCVVIGLGLLWRATRHAHVLWPTSALVGSMLMGFGGFNVVEGVVNHQLLGLHHVNELVPRAQWIYWDAAFLVWGLAMLIGGWRLWRNATMRRYRTAT